MVSFEASLGFVASPAVDLTIATTNISAADKTALKSRAVYIMESSFVKAVSVVRRYVEI